MFADVVPVPPPSREIQQALVDAIWLLKPEMILGLFACLLFLGGTVTARRGLWGFVALIGLLVALWLSFDARESTAIGMFVVPIRVDSLASFTRILAIVSGIVLLLLSWDELPEKQSADHHACLLVLIAGLSMVGSANDLIALFLALELVSIPTYILLYLPRHDDASQEAALKYFLLSIFSSGVLLFGFSYLYGLVGSTNLSVILDTLTANRPESPTIALIALVTIVCGLAFRLTAVPFHFYAPDVYQGTANVTAALLSFVPKLAGVIALIRLLGYVWPSEHGAPLVGTALSDQVPLIFWILAVLTMFLGNLLALRQEHVRRIMAYSSIANAGYMLVALSSAPYLRHSSGPDGVEAVLYYLVAYGAMTVGVFAILAYLDSDERRIDTLDDLAGLSKEHPVLSILLAVFLFSLIGIPLTAGFTGKFLILFGALALQDQQATLYRVLAVLMAINAAIAGWYYLRIVATLYLRTPLKPFPVERSVPGLVTIGLCAILTVGLSVPPGLTWLQQAVTVAVRGTDAAPAVARR
jgi:NADH-quinone oxidoreductase subunit N